MPEPTDKFVLHVDDAKRWTNTVGNHLNREGLPVVSYTVLDAAKRHFEKHESEIALVICDGTVNISNDGHEWAKKLHAAGKKVMSLSSGDAGEGVPSFLKADFQNGRAFVEMVRTLIGRPE